MFKGAQPECSLGQGGPLRATPAGAATRTPHQEQTAGHLMACPILIYRPDPPRTLRCWAGQAYEPVCTPFEGTGPPGHSHSSPRHPWSSSGLPCLPAAACSASQTPPWPPGPPLGPGPGTGLWFPFPWPLLPLGLAPPRSGQRCSFLPLTATWTATGNSKNNLKSNMNFSRSSHV